MAQFKLVAIKRVQGNVYDAFWENGWTQWSRFLFKKGEITALKGKAISAQDKAQLLELMLRT